MFAVIFRANPDLQDDEYKQTISKMRELAFDKYACIDFIISFLYVGAGRPIDHTLAV